MYARWLSLQSTMVPGAASALLSLQPDPDRVQTSATVWPQDTQVPAKLYDVAAMALSRRVPIVVDDGAGGEPGSDEHAADIAFPLLEDNRVWGVVAVRTTAAPDRHQSIVQLLRWGAGWLDFVRSDAQSKAHAAPADARARDADIATLSVTRAVLAEADPRVARLQLCAALADEFGAARVSLARIGRAGAELEAGTDGAVHDRHTPVVRCIEAAMDEALDQALPIATPAPDTAEPVSRLAQKALLERTGNAAVLTLPLLADGAAVGAICLEFARGDALDARVHEAAGAAAATLGPLFARLQSLGRRRLRVAGTWFGRHRLLAWTTVVLLLGALGVALDRISTIGYIKAPAVLEGAVQRAIVAPFDGYVSGANARAGETVARGQVLADLDVSELELGLRRLHGDRDALVQRHRRAFAALDRSEAAILDAQLQQIHARIELLQGQLDRARLLAPFDGVIVRGDLSRTLGRPVSRGEVLFEIAPLDRYRVVLEVEATDVAELHEGQRGRLRLAALPDTPVEVEVLSISAVSSAEAENRSGTFRVEAMVSGGVAGLRPGMQGIARLDAGERSVLDVWTWPLQAALSRWWWSVAP